MTSIEKDDSLHTDRRDLLAMVLAGGAAAALPAGEIDLARAINPRSVDHIRGSGPASTSRA